MADLPKLLSIQEVAEALNIAKITVYKMVSAKRIPFVKLGSRVLFEPEKIGAWIEQRSFKPLNSNRS
jgi:excisionase family DNA binding protein